MSVEIYDIETISNFFSYCGMDKDTKKVSKFIIHKSNNQLRELVSHLGKLKGQIGYNNLSFDSQVIQYILNESQEWVDYELDGDQVSRLIYNYSQYVINKSNTKQFLDFPEWKLSIPQLDLFKIWHFDNANKFTSLKWIEYSIDMDSIEEMPISRTEEVEDHQIQSILDYNEHDIKATYEFYKITKGETNISLYKGVDKIKFRQDVKNEFGIKCDNYNDVKIGDEINKSNYCIITGLDKKSLPKSTKSIKPFKFKDCYPKYMKFKDQKFIDFVNIVGNNEVSLKAKGKKDKKQDFEFTYNGTTYLMAKGGLHSKDKARIVIPKANEILRDCDVGSMYPNAIAKRGLFPAHLGQEWLNGYQDVIKRRIQAKNLYKSTKDPKYQAIQEALKVSLNGGSFGKTNEEYNWQYDPKVTFDVTIGSQIDLLMLIESLELGGIHVISANTDGLVCLFDKSLEDSYYKICKEWEVNVGNDKLGQLEYTDYVKLIQTSVNDYITVKTDCNIKCKGDFVSEFEIHKNKSARVIPLALQEYYTKGYPVDKFIKEHDNIFDFCLGCKSIGSNRLVAFDKEQQTETKLQKINRYYISNKGVHIIKKLPKLANKKALMQINIFGDLDDGTRTQEIEAGYVSTVYNKHIKNVDIKDRDINYDYYINRCNKIINQIV